MLLSPELYPGCFINYNAAFPQICAAAVEARTWASDFEAESTSFITNFDRFWWQQQLSRPVAQSPSQLIFVINFGHN